MLPAAGRLWGGAGLRRRVDAVSTELKSIGCQERACRSFGETLVLTYGCHPTNGGRNTVTRRSSPCRESPRPSNPAAPLCAAARASGSPKQSGHLLPSVL